MIQPPFLKNGDTIGIPAPGRKLSPEVIEAAAGIIKSYGFHVRIGKNIFSTSHSYLSGSDSERLADLQEMLNDDSIQAILCARGGYGTTRILDQLDFRAFLKNPKWVCGFSDITALHLKLQKMRIQSIHSSMPVVFPKPETKSSIESLFALLGGRPMGVETEGNSHNKIGSASGQLIGGNLSLIVDSLGTSTEIDTKSKILVLEEVDEFVYRIDRMFVQLKRAGKLTELAGLVIGHFTDIKETELNFGEPVLGIIHNYVKEYTYPVGFNFPVGHENPNIAWVQGAVGELNVTKQKSTLTF